MPDVLSIEALLLDIDGTLLDTRRYILAAFSHTASAHGLRLPHDDVMTGNIGRPLDRIYGELGALASDMAELIETHRAFQEENLHLVEGFPEADRTLTELRRSGLLLAAVTSRSRRTSSASLDHAGIGHHFALVISAEDAPALKPDPAPLRAALAALDRQARHCIMVGDTVHDIEAGAALGMRTIGARYGFGGEAMLAASPTSTIWSLRELPSAVVALQRG